MKIGDNVRFLSETGGGVIAGFKDKSVVLVEDEDGFQIPTPITDLVIVDDDQMSKLSTGSYTGASVDLKGKRMTEVKNNTHTGKTLLYNSKSETDSNDLRLDMLSVYLVFVPSEIKGDTIESLDLYIVNDCDYDLYFTLSSLKSGQQTLIYSGKIEADTKIKLKNVEVKNVDIFEHAHIQLIAFKHDMPYVQKPAIDVPVNISSVKFCKQNSFTENLFFNSPALVHPIIENDKIDKPLVIDARKLEVEMMMKKNADTQNEIPKPKDDKKKSENEPIIVDLHASEVLETTAGMSSGDILKYQMDIFRRTIDENRANKGMKIIFIHGKGNGVLRKAILSELNYKYKQFPYQDASFQEYGFGATQITIR